MSISTNFPSPVVLSAIDNLESTSVVFPLSANQGRLLDERLSTVEDNEDTLFGVVNTLENKQEAQNAELTNLVPQVGTDVLTNSRTYPFNDSESVITLATPTITTDYRVEVELLSGLNVGAITISDKQLNGFKLAYTGSCPEAVLKYFVIGGY